MKSILNILISSILAGGAIALGAAANIACNDKIFGSIFFSIGLICICSFKWHLFTGKVPYLFDVPKSSIWNNCLQLIIIWIGNVIGASLVGKLIFYSKLSSYTFESVNMIVENKMCANDVELFLSGICCNLLIYIAVEGFKEINNSIGKYLFVIMGVSTFVVCGYDHCIANCAYLSLSNVATFDISYMNIVYIPTFGNAIGGLIIHNMHRRWKDI